mgnify:CR=1 FL=1
MDETELQEKVEAQEKELNELRPFKDSSTKLQEEFKTKEEAWQKEKAELESQANPNWQKARKSIESMRAALESKGVKVDEEGNVITNPNNIDVEKIRQEALQAGRSEATKTLIENRLEEILNEYDKDSAAVIKHYYGKLTAGEVLSLQNIGQFVRQAVNAASSSPENKITKAAQFSGGLGPRGREREENAIDPTIHEELAQKMGLRINQNK